MGRAPTPEELSEAIEQEKISEKIMEKQPEKPKGKWHGRKPWEEPELSQEEIDKQDESFFEGMGIIPESSARGHRMFDKEFMKKADPDEDDTRPVELRKPPDISIDYEEINIRGLASDEDINKLRKVRDGRADKTLPKEFGLADVCPLCGKTILECRCDREPKDESLKIW